MTVIPNESYLMIIGAMKSGTSSLYALLCQHPEICQCIGKEPEFFSEFQDHGHDVEKYEELWDFKPEQHKYVIEASTGYSKFPDEPNVASNIKKYGINPVFLYIVRDPLKRIESDYNFSRNKAWFDPSVEITDERYSVLSNYYVQLKPYFENFGRERIIILDFDVLISDPERLLNELCQKLNLSPFEFQRISEVFNPTKEIYKVQQWISNIPIFQKLYRQIPKSIKQFLKKAPLLDIKTEKRVLSSSERQKIVDDLTADISKFGSEYNFPIEKWNF